MLGNTGTIVFLALRSKGTNFESTSRFAIDLFDVVRKENLSRGIDTDPESLERPEGICKNIWGSLPPLYCASLWGLIELVWMLVDRDHQDEIGGFCGTPLQAAASNYYTEIVALLLDRGITLNLVSEYYGDALQAAAYRDHGPSVKMLLNARADVNATCGHYGHALQAAAANGHAKLVQLLLANRADVIARGGEYESSRSRG